MGAPTSEVGYTSATTRMGGPRSVYGVALVGRGGGLLYAALLPIKKGFINVNSSEPHKNYRYASSIETSDVELLAYMIKLTSGLLVVLKYN
jgi:hypothetical protein